MVVRPSTRGAVAGPSPNSTDTRSSGGRDASNGTTTSVASVPRGTGYQPVTRVPRPLLSGVTSCQTRPRPGTGAGGGTASGTSPVTRAAPTGAPSAGRTGDRTVTSLSSPQPPR